MTTPRNPTGFGDGLDPDPAGSDEEYWPLDDPFDDDGDADDDLDDLFEDEDG